MRTTNKNKGGGGENHIFYSCYCRGGDKYRSHIVNATQILRFNALSFCRTLKVFCEEKYSCMVTFPCCLLLKRGTVLLSWQSHGYKEGAGHFFFVCKNSRQEIGQVAAEYLEVSRTREKEEKKRKKKKKKKKPN